MKIKSIRLKTALNFLIASLISIFFTTVVMSIFIQYRFESFALVWSTVLFLAMGAAVVAFGASWYLSQRLTTPINQMSEMARKIGEGDFDHRVIITGGDELQDLAENLNSTAFQLKMRVQEAQEEKTKIGSMLANIADGVIVTNAEGRIELFNPKAERIFGTEVENALGRSIIEITQSYQLQDLIENALAGKKGHTELKLTFPRRKILEVKTSFLREPNGTIFGTITTFDDITKVRSLKKARRDFTANVSHELRTPVSSIKALTESLIAGAKDEPDKATQFLENIHKETERLTCLINDILDLSRLESSETPIEQEEVNLGDLALRLVERFQPAASRKSVQLKTEDSSENIKILGDYDQVMLALSNLLDNAVKYTPEGGEVTIKLSGDEKKAQLSVSDTGIGIPTKDIHRIFERFYVVDRARSREFGGTGLGLSIVKHVVENHCGKVKVKSVLGKGSTFTISFPRVPAEE